MDYTSQSEKLFKFLDLELDFGEKIEINNIKKRFFSDFNLFACFIKDFLTLKNGFLAPLDNEIYSDFVLYFKNADKNQLIKDLADYSTIFLKIVFEEEKNPLFKNTIAIVNSCYSLEYYPLIMYFAKEYNDKKFDIAMLDRILKAIDTNVLNNFEAEKNIDIADEFLSYEKILSGKERIAS